MFRKVAEQRRTLSNLYYELDSVSFSGAGSEPDVRFTGGQCCLNSIIGAETDLLFINLVADGVLAGALFHMYITVASRTNCCLITVVFFVGGPAQIGNAIVQTVVINVVHGFPVVGIWNECFSDYAMEQS